MTLSKNKIKYIQSLKDKKQRVLHNTFVAEGDKMVGELLTILPCQLLVSTSRFFEKYEHSSFFKLDEFIVVSEEELARISFVKTPQQAIAIFFQPHYVYDLFSLKNQLCLALDGIQDPGNLGTIIRLADWYGIEHIFCSKDTADLYNPKVVQATMGAIARVKIHYVDLASFLQSVGEIPICGTFLDGQNMYDVELPDSGIIVMGNEGKGIRSEIENLISRRLFIPNYPPNRETSESLNVALATAIICSEFRRLQIKK